MITDVQQSSFSGVVFANAIGWLRRLFEDRWSVKRTLTMRSINNLRYKRQVRDWPIVWQLVFVKGRFLEERKYCRFFKNGMESTRAEREINNVGNWGDEYRRTIFEKPSGYRVRIRLFVGTVEQDVIDFRFRYRPEGRKNRRCWWWRRGMWRHSRTAGSRDPKTGNFVCEERSKAVCEWSDRGAWRKAKVMKICDEVICLQFARDGGDFQMKKKLSVSSIAF